MSLDNVTPGKNVPDNFNVIIEIPMNADPVKYEVDKETGAIFVDRFMSTSMHYPTNYGYVPKTISGDGDPVDVLVITPVPLIPGVVVTCRPIGILKMEDEAGEDGKVLAVPIDKILSIYTQWQKPEDLNPLRLKTIAHFFEHYKDLEPGKWVKILGWEGPDAARKEILDGIANYQACTPDALRAAAPAPSAVRVRVKRPDSRPPCARKGRQAPSGCDSRSATAHQALGFSPMPTWLATTSMFSVCGL
jgi:inorganic pyrophosphatase